MVHFEEVSREDREGGDEKEHFSLRHLRGLRAKVFLKHFKLYHYQISSTPLPPAQKSEKTEKMREN